MSETDLFEQYSNQWRISSEQLYTNGTYRWMAERIAVYPTVLEIGCGSGYSTLSLVEQEHKVIAIDWNDSCIAGAKKLLADRGFRVSSDLSELDISDVIILKYDIMLVDNVIKFPNLQIDIVAIWNPGGGILGKLHQDHKTAMLMYGLTRSHISSNRESSYSECLIYHCYQLAIKHNVPINIVDRNDRALDASNDTYFRTIDDRGYFSKIEYKNLETTTFSEGGKVMLIKGEVQRKHEIPVVFISVLIK